MSQFPEAIPLASHVALKRRMRLRRLLRVSLIGIGLRVAIVTVEGAAFYFSQSAALWMDALSCLYDILGSFLLLLCLFLAEKPPDRDHPFGHGRYEPLAGLQLAVFLTLLGIYGLFQQSAHFAHSSVQPLFSVSSVWYIPWLSVILMELGAQILLKAAREEKSTALSVDAYHYRIDALTSGLAGVALSAGFFFPQQASLLDHLGGMVIALFMIGTGLSAIRSTLPQLMDKIPEEAYFVRVQEAARCVPGVKDVEKTKIQVYGPDAHVDIDVEVDPLLSVVEAHRVSQRVRAAIQEKWPAVRDVSVHIEPYYPNDHIHTKRRI